MASMPWGVRVHSVRGRSSSVGGQSQQPAFRCRDRKRDQLNPNAAVPSTHYVVWVYAYAGGSFSTVGGQSRQTLAALDTTTGNATSWNPTPAGRSFVGPSIRALAVSGSTVYTAGGFTSIGGQPRNKLAALDAGTGNATSWNPDPNGEVKALAISGSTVYVGGSYSVIGGQDRQGLGAVSSATGNATNWDPRLNIGGIVYGLGSPVAPYSQGATSHRQVHRSPVRTLKSPTPSCCPGHHPASHFGDHPV